MTHHKLHLPQKICACCGLAFSWLQSWQQNWPEVKYCSERCRRKKTE